MSSTPTIDRPARRGVLLTDGPSSLAAPPFARRHREGLLAVVVAGVAVTALVATAPSLRSGVQRPALHVQVATAAALVALLVALLAAGRYRRAPALTDLLLAVSFAVLGSANLLTSAVQGATGESPSGPLAWTPLAARLVAAALLAGAALAGDVGRRPSLATAAGRNAGRRPSLATAAGRNPGLAARAVALGSLGALALLALALAALDPRQPHLGGAGAHAAAAPFGLLAGSTASVMLKGACLGLIAVAAVGFARRGWRTPDRLAVPLSWGTALLAFAWLNSLLVPSLYVNWFYAGDALGLAAYVVLAAGAVGEIRDYQRDRTRLAALEERGRVARELHDGVAQEVLYVLGQARRLQTQQPGPDAERLLGAAERALAESRAAISALRAPVDERLPAALARVGGELGRRLELDVRVEADADVEVAPVVRDALVRIVGEALANAARHGAARHATVVLRVGPPSRLLVRDDGCGFDPDPARVPAGAFGLQTMRERAAAVGARTQVRSAPGSGTEVEVTLP